MFFLFLPGLSEIIIIHSLIDFRQDELEIRDLPSAASRGPRPATCDLRPAACDSRCTGFGAGSTAAFLQNIGPGPAFHTVTSEAASKISVSSFLGTYHNLCSDQLWINLY